ncbi:MAG: NFACT family protein, partial [Clostridia bacterium]|nr:NFACT family protein [Clostridia bacterium]
ELDALEKQLTTLQTLLKQNGGTPTMVTDPVGKPIDFTFFPVTQYKNGATLSHFSGYCALLDAFYSNRDQKARLQSKTHTLTKFLNTTLARLTRTVNVRTQELKAAQNCEQLREYGELLKANLHLIKAGSQACRVINYYDPECKEITIPLSPALSPAANAGRYFKEYRKKCTAAGMLKGLIEKAQTDIAYLDSVREALSRVETAAEITAIEQELHDSGWLKKRQNKKGKVQSVKELPPYEFLSPDGFTILAGRNNRQNDKLTLKLADKGDIWFHTKNIPGSHVIVKTEGKPVPDSTLTMAAELAATLSAGVESAGVAVDYCPVKRVKKPAGSPPGMVIYETYNTAFVNPNKALLEEYKVAKS